LWTTWKTTSADAVSGPVWTISPTIGTGARSEAVGAPGWCTITAPLRLAFLPDGFLGFAPPKEVSAAGMFYALRALEIDNTLAETHALFGMYRKDIDSDSEMKRALDIDRRASHGRRTFQRASATSTMHSSGCTARLRPATPC